MKKKRSEWTQRIGTRRREKKMKKKRSEWTHTNTEEDTNDKEEEWQLKRRTRGTQQRRSVGVTRDVGLHEEQKKLEKTSSKRREEERERNRREHKRTFHSIWWAHSTLRTRATSKNRRNKRDSTSNTWTHDQGSTCHEHTPVENGTMDVDVHSTSDMTHMSKVGPARKTARDLSRSPLDPTVLGPLLVGRFHQTWLSTCCWFLRVADTQQTMSIAKNRSWVWLFYVRGHPVPADQAKCILCKKILSFGDDLSTRALGRHLVDVHRISTDNTEVKDNVIEKKEGTGVVVVLWLHLFNSHLTNCCLFCFYIWYIYIYFFSHHYFFFHRLYIFFFLLCPTFYYFFILCDAQCFPLHFMCYPFHHSWRK